MSDDTLTGAGLVEAVARAIDNYVNPYSPVSMSPTRHMLYAPHARAALRAVVEAAHVDALTLRAAAASLLLQWTVADLLRALAEVVEAGDG